MAIGDWFKGKKEKEKPQGKPKVNISIGATSLDGYGTTMSTNPVSYKPTYDFPDYFHAYATFFYIPPKVGDLKLHELFIKYPDKYPFIIKDPLETKSGLKPISFSIELIKLFDKKANMSEAERGRIHLGRIPGFTDEAGEPRKNDIILSMILEQYREVFKYKFNIDPIESNGTNAFNYDDPRGTINPQTKKVKIRGINDVSRGQFTLFATGNSISIADGRTGKSTLGELINKPSTNGTLLFDTSGDFKTLSQCPELEVIARAPISEFHKPSDSAYASFGHELVTLGDKYSGIKGYTFLMFVTPNALVTPETLKQEFAFKYAR